MLPPRLARWPFLADLLNAPPAPSGAAAQPARRAALKAGGGALAAGAAWALGPSTAMAAAASSPGSAVSAPPAALGVQRGRVLRFPQDHGAHPDTQTEWWYATGWAGPDDAPRLGWQLTFFRSRTNLAAGLPGRLAPRQLLFAHAAVTDLATGRHHHSQRIARWAGDQPSPQADAALDNTRLRLARWRFERQGDTCVAELPAADGERFGLALQLRAVQPLLLQGDAGFSQKGPQPQHASHYYSQPQLALSGNVQLEGQRLAFSQGRGWLDHEWSEALLAEDAVGWDWVGFNLFDGSALTAFRLRRADGTALWAGGSFRTGAGVLRIFKADEVRFEPGRRWTSPATRAAYPVDWRLHTPAGSFRVAALLDSQEMDSRGSTGSVYWEGLSALQDDAGRRVGLGYLEMTGYTSRLRLS
jgi:predicted secreted hydrolase